MHDLEHDPDGLEPEATPPRPPAWEQYPLEPPEAFAHFRAYLAGPDRHVAAFARRETTGLATSTVLGIAARWRWHARRLAFEAHCHEAFAEGAAEAARERGAAQARIVDAIEAIAWQGFEQLSDRLAAGEKIPMREVREFLSKALEARRLLAGEATSRVAVDAGEAAALAALSTEELEALAAIRAKLDQGAGGGGT